MASQVVLAATQPHQIFLCLVPFPRDFVPPSSSGAWEETIAKKTLSSNFFQPTGHSIDADFDLTPLFLCLVSLQLALYSSSLGHLSQQRTAPSVNIGVKNYQMEGVFFGFLGGFVVFCFLFLGFFSSRINKGIHYQAAKHLLGKHFASWWALGWFTWGQKQDVWKSYVELQV